MIKFFRKIRRNLLSEGKTGKYIIYAIGEIVLVVIGILIALQLNKLNEERNRANQEHKILGSLKSDFLESKVRLENTMFQQIRSVNQSIALIQIYEDKMPMPINDTIVKYLQFGAYSWYRAEMVTGAYDALINTGNSELIKNDKLTKLLAEYFSIVNSTFEDHESSMNHIYSMQKIAESTLLPLAEPSLKKWIGLDTIRNPNEDAALKFLFEQDAFFGHLYFKTILEHLRYTIQQDLLTRIEEILSIINNELDPLKESKR